MMFSSNPFPHLTSSIQVFPPSSSFLDNEKDDLYIYQQDQGNNPFLPGDCFPSREKFSTSKHDLLEELGLEENNEYTLISGSGTKKNHTSKKDHHSKIHTSQGPRNRRVRLSIEVAKKFFYLQDLQGFDKASKTLDWLFKQSKIPIDELVKMKKQSSSSTVSDHSEVVFAENFKGLGEEDKVPKKKKCIEGKRKKITRKYQSASPVNQSRAEARERARERTKEKLNIKKLESRSVYYSDCCSLNSTLQSNFWSDIESDKIEESLIGKKISIPSSMLYSYQPNLDMSNDSSSSSSKFNSNSFPNFTVAYEQKGDITTI